MIIQAIRPAVNSIQTLGRSSRPQIPLLCFLVAALLGCGRPAESARSSGESEDQLQAFSGPLNAGSAAATDTRASESSSDESTLPQYELRMEPRHLAELDRNPLSNETYPATFTAGGQDYRVKVRYRGAFARSWQKKPMKIFFQDGALFEGKDRLNLNSAWRDPAFVREHLAYQVYAACGAPASKSRMVQLHLNGSFRGLYVEVEQPDKHFVKRLGLSGASVFKASSRSGQADERDLGSEAAFAAHYEKETQKETGYGDLREFCQELARRTDVARFFSEKVDLEKYVNYLAATTLLQNWDGYNKNHFIVFDGRTSKKWFAVPWDLDRTLGDHWNWSFNKTDLPILLGTRQLPGVTGWNRMADRFFSSPQLRMMYLRRLRQLLETEFTVEKLWPVLDRLESQIGAAAKLDRRQWPGPAGDFHDGIAEVKRFIQRRRAYLLKELAGLIGTNASPLP